ncbi:helix-turn-helix domain-containing protein [Megasphaera elsdenii]|uniref:helix-turn-helix domain-containing protein n=1 Tax=Megasphaera elsdenii TaxID=907 RepID=UPI003D05D2F8|nr:helix-turn-helix domain-containing protein [Megasphaera elsdenii]
MTSLGEKLKEVRTEKHLSMNDLSNEFKKCYDLNVTKSMISRWEHDLAQPSNSFLAAYAKFFNLDMNSLLGIDNQNSGKTYSSILNRAQRELSPEELKAVESLASYFMDKNKRGEK